MKKGFTLAEVLVTISIIAILSVFGIGSFIGARQNSQLRADLIKINYTLREVQNLSLSPSNRIFKDILNNNSSTKICSVGVRFTRPNIIRRYYTTNSSGVCGTPQFADTMVLDYSEFNSDINFEFSAFTGRKINPRSTTSISVNLINSSISKNVTVKDTGLIKVE